MDQNVIAQLKKAGIDTTLKVAVPFVAIQVDEAKRPVPVSAEIGIQSGEAFTTVDLKKISELFTGNRQPPEMGHEAPAEYTLFLASIEKPVMDYMETAGQPETDADLAELYRHLRRRPDGTHSKPVFSYMQAGARFYMSLRDVSRSEFEAVIQRLAQSAKNFSQGYSSTNYFRVVGAQFRGEL
jgi:hypothetical protein